MNNMISQIEYMIGYIAYRYNRMNINTQGVSREFDHYDISRDDENDGIMFFLENSLGLGLKITYYN